MVYGPWTMDYKQTAKHKGIRKSSFVTRKSEILNQKSPKNPYLCADY